MLRIVVFDYRIAMNLLELAWGMLQCIQRFIGAISIARLNTYEGQKPLRLKAGQKTYPEVLPPALVLVLELRSESTRGSSLFIMSEL